MDTSEVDIHFFFPDELRGKKLCKYHDEEISKKLSAYLKTEDPEYLFEAIKKDNRLLYSHYPTNLVSHEPLPKKLFKDGLDPGTIIWSSIVNWQWIHITWRTRKDIVKQTERLLRRIGLALIPNDIKSYAERDFLDIFTYVVPKRKGDSPHLKLKDRQKFLAHWDEVEKAFKDGLKKRYQGPTETLFNELKQEGEELTAFGTMILAYGKPLPKVSDIKDIIENNFNDPITKEEIMLNFNTSDIKKIVASYIAWKYERACRNNGNQSLKIPNTVSYKSILNLLKQAEETQSID